MSMIDVALSEMDLAAAARDREQAQAEAARVWLRQVVGRWRAGVGDGGALAAVRYTGDRYMTAIVHEMFDRHPDLGDGWLVSGPGVALCLPANWRRQMPRGAVPVRVVGACGRSGWSGLARDEQGDLWVSGDAQFRWQPAYGGAEGLAKTAAATLRGAQARVERTKR